MGQMPIDFALSGLEKTVIQAEALMETALTTGGEELLRVLELLIYYREAQFHDCPGDAAAAIIERVNFALEAPKSVPIWRPDKDGKLSQEQLQEINDWSAWSGVSPLDVAYPISL